jgi:hypothetical protein
LPSDIENSYVFLPTDTKEFKSQKNSNSKGPLTNPPSHITTHLSPSATKTQKPLADFFAQQHPPPKLARRSTNPQGNTNDNANN